MIAENIEAEQLGVMNFLKNKGYYRAKSGGFISRSTPFKALIEAH
jgi:hypothetical protein